MLVKKIISLSNILNSDFFILNLIDGGNPTKGNG